MDEVEGWIGRLRQRLSNDLPGHDAQLAMAPAYRMDRKQASIDGKRCRHAGVLVVLYPEDEVLNLLLTVRPDHMTVHAGQISFPGGRREGDESMLDAALREAHEEVGLSREVVEVLGGLTPLYIPPSNFCVHPFVAFCPELPSLRPTDEEVHAVLHVSLSELFDFGSRKAEVWTLRGEAVEVPFYAYQSYKIWGATAMVLAELDAVLADIDAPDRRQL